MNIISNIKKYIVTNITSNRFKYSIIIYAIASVHVLLIVLFTLLGILPLAIFNIGSVITYITCINIIKYGYEKNIINVFYITYIEIIVHSFVATICVGWSLGFPQYIIGLIPFGYYICATMMEGRHKYRTATLLGIVAYLSFIGCRMITLVSGSIYELDISPIAKSLIYAFNATCNFGFLFMVTLVFVVDMQITTNKLHMQNAALDNMASVDPLTSLYNRRSMHVFLDAAVESDAPFCLVMCDIDNFKKVNDNYGHDFGDVVLKDIAHIIQELVSDNGHVCRWGGEEILILSNGSLDNTCKIAENIRRDVESHSFRLHEKTIRCSITLGIAAHQSGATIEETITHADNRLYYGKQNGKNRVVSPYDTA